MKQEPPAALRLGLVDGFRLSASCGGDLPRGARRVVAFLALHEQRLRRDFVAYSLWPEAREDRAAANLRTALWELQRHGPDRLLLATTGSLGLHPNIEVDVHRLSELAFTLDQGLPVVPSNELVAAYAGELLPDWYEDWVLPQRARWREARVHALESLAGASVRGGRFLLALVAARTAVAVEPFRETSRRALIEAYMSEGNQGQAAVEYRRYEALLAEEVGAAPSNELRALVMGGQRPLSKRSVAAS